LREQRGFLDLFGLYGGRGTRITRIERISQIFILGVVVKISTRMNADSHGLVFGIVSSIKNRSICGRPRFLMGGVICQYISLMM
jgi:hypothetical protein